MIRSTAQGSMVRVAPLETPMSKVTTCGLAAAVQCSSAEMVPSCVVPAPVGVTQVAATEPSGSPGVVVQARTDRARTHAGSFMSR